MALSKFNMLCTHPHDLFLECFYHTNQKSCVQYCRGPDSASTQACF